MLKRSSVAVAAALGLLAALAMTAPTAASAQDRAASGSSNPGGDLAVQVSIDRFRAKRGETIANGTATAELVDYTGNKTTLRLPVTLTAKRSGSCRILKLTLDQLTLSLLGLNVNLSKVELSVTGRPGGGVLGSLFCKLSRAKVK